MRAFHLFKKCTSVSKLDKTQYNKLLKQVTTLSMDEKEKLSIHINQQKIRSTNHLLLDWICFSINTMGIIFFVIEDIRLIPFFGVGGVCCFIESCKDIKTISRLDELSDEIISDKD